MNQRETLKILDNGHIEIGGLDVKDLAEKFGTPLYVMDRKHIENMCLTYKNSLDNYYGDGQVCYASKAFCCKEMYRILNSFNMGADVVSLGEFKTALSVNFPAKNLVFHGNNKNYADLEFAVKNGIGLIVIDSYLEALDLDEICQKLNVKQDVLVRVNPGVEAHTHHYIQTANIDSKFGFSISNGDAFNIAKDILQLKNIKLKGFHCHIGSQIFENKSFLIAVDKMTDFYKKLKNELNFDCDILNLGGGFGIYYAENDLKYNLDNYSNCIKAICERLLERIDELSLKKPYLILEPGRSIVGEAGITLYSVGRIREIKNIKNYIAINGGMFENPRYALYQAKYTVCAAEKMLQKPVKKYSIAGKCCESGDIIAEDCMLPEMKENDIIAVLSTGAYNYSMASNYNRNCIPPVVMVKNGVAKYVVKPQTHEDIMQNDI